MTAAESDQISARCAKLYIPSGRKGAIDRCRAVVHSRIVSPIVDGVVGIGQSGIGARSKTGRTNRNIRSGDVRAGCEKKRW